MLRSNGGFGNAITVPIGSRAVKNAEEWLKSSPIMGRYKHRRLRGAAGVRSRSVWPRNMAIRGFVMDSKKIQRVRRLIAGGFYTDPEILESLEHVLVERHWERLVRDIDGCNDVCLCRNSCDEQAAGVHAQIVDDLMQYPLGDGDKYHDILADTVAGSLRKLADLALAHKTMSLHPR